MADLYLKKKPNDVDIQNQDKNKDEENQHLISKQNKKEQFENFNVNEQHEKDLNDKLDSADDKITIAYKNSIEFDMSTRKREVKMKKEDKYEMEKMRRWHVKINNIYITALMKMIDPFIQFTIGGNFMVNVYKNKKGESYKIPAGKRGFSDKTEVILNVSPPQEDSQTGGRTPFNKVIDIEMRMSYSMINKQKMMLELWEHNNFWMNAIHSYILIPIIDIVNGSCNIGEYMLKKENGRKNPLPFAYVEFNCVFQEIWDFKLSFANWKSTNLLNPKKKNHQSQLPSTKVKIQLVNKSLGVHNSATSEEAKESITPIWGAFDGSILFRGTCSELENEDVKLTVYNTKGLIDQEITSRQIGLRGIIDFEKLKTEMIIRDKEEGENYPITVQGFVSIDNKPKYHQSGMNVMLLSTKKYLVIKVMRVENIRPAETRGIVDSFISVEWCGINQRTKTVKENNNPSFNEFLFFIVPLPDEWLANIDKYLLKINEELSSKNEVSFNLMIEGDDNTYDNFGIGYFYLSEIKGGNKMQEKYFAEDLKKEKKYLSEKYTGKIKLISAFSQSNNTFVHFEAWFLDNFPPSVDFGEKKKKSERADKVPLELSKYFPRGKDAYLNKEFKNKIHNTFLKYSNYPYKDRTFTNLSPQDQYTNLHLLPYYLSPITVPEKKYSKRDVDTNPNFFDCNMTSLDEIAHFVRCFAYPNDLKNDIWSTPDFMLKLRKGNVEDHAILMACLMLGLRKKMPTMSYANDLNDQNEKDGLIDTDTPNGAKTKTPSDKNADSYTMLEPEKDILIETIEDVFPYENRIFVCQGKLKETKAIHTWVMSISNDYRNITFWDPKLFIQFDLIGRVKEPEKLKNFLHGDYPNYLSVTMNKVEKYKQETIDVNQPKKKKKKDMDQIVLKGEREDSIIGYEEDDDFKDELVNDNESISGNKKAINKKMVDDKIAFEVNDENKKEAFNFVAHDKTIDDEINKGNEKNFLPVDIFKDNTGQPVPDIQLPYETIDLIFNQNNIYANCQYHSPEQIWYNLYEKSQWLPYFYVDENIWRGKFEPFYSLCNFGPVYSPTLVKKMTDSLIKEMRVGIAAARSGKNLPTRFKKKNERINKQLSKYLDYIENRNLNRITEEEFNKSKLDWEVVVQKYMPKFYRMEAQTVFFNFFETEIIRREITDELESFWYTKVKNVVFATSARVYAYPNQIVSVRIIIAKFYRIPLEDIRDKEEEKEYLEMQKEDPNKLVEEEVESEEEEDIIAMKEANEKKNKEATTEVNPLVTPEDGDKGEEDKDEKGDKKDKKNKKDKKDKKTKNNKDKKDNKEEKDKEDKKKEIDPKIVVENKK